MIQGVVYLADPSKYLDNESNQAAMPMTNHMSLIIIYVSYKALCNASLYWYFFSITWELFWLINQMLYNEIWF